MKKYDNAIELFMSVSNSNERGIVFITEDGEEYVSYHNLCFSAQKALSALQKNKVKKGDKVILQCTNNKNFLISMWACILGGIIPMPLAKCKSEEEWERIVHIWNSIDNIYIVLENKERNTFLSQLGLDKAEGMKKYAAQIILEEELVEAQASGIIAEVSNEDIFDIQYSSGTSSEPKGVMITHSNVVNIEDMLVNDFVQIRENDVSLCWLPLTHCFGFYMGFLASMYCDKTQILMEKDLFTKDPLLWLKYMSDYKVTVSYAPNFAYNLVTKCIQMEEPKYDLSSVEFLFSGAELVSYDDVQRFENALSKCGLKKGSVKSAYGLSEITVCTSSTKREEFLKSLWIDRESMGIGEKVVICEESTHEKAIQICGVGSIFQGIGYKIADEDGQDLGELKIGYFTLRSKTVMRGYYLDDAATSKVLDKDGWFNTEDLGFVYDTNLYLTGRAKDLIVINGHNFYPQDIEQRLSKLFQLEISKIAVCSRLNTSTGTEEIFIFLALDEEEQVFAEKRKSISRAVVAYMHADVAGIFQVAKIPATSSGKKQRRKLLEGIECIQVRKDEERKVIKDELTEIEDKLFFIWNQVLANSDFGKQDNFFSVSGNSIKAIAVVTKIRQEFLIDLSLNQLFLTPTIQDLARIIKSSAEKNTIVLEKTKTADAYSLSTMQKSQFLAGQMEAAEKAYHIALAYEILGDLDERKLKEVMKTIAKRHEILRASFHIDNAEIFQKIENTVDFTVETVENGSFDTLFYYIHNYDLNKAPLFRVILVKDSEERKYLIIDAHHIVFDGISVPILLDELKELYLGRELEALRFQYVDFVDWQKKLRGTDNFKKKLNNWKYKFSKQIAMEEWKCEPNEGSKGYQYYNYQPDERLLEALENVVSGSRTKYVVLMTAYHLLLHKYTGSQDVVVGAPFNGRTVEGTDQMIGMFVNTLPIRSSIDLEDSVENYLTQIERALIEAQENQEVQYEEIMEALKADGLCERSTLFNTMLVLQNMNIDERKIGTVSLKLIDYKAHTEQFDMVVHVIEQRENFWLKFEYNTEIFDSNQIVKICSHYVNLMISISKSLDQKLRNISYLTQEEEKLITAYNRTECDFTDMTLGDMFHMSVADNHDQVAIVCGEASITYGKLDVESDKVAAYLMQQENLQSEFIAIQGKREIGTIINILGIIKAGKAYIPINLDVPEKKINQIMQDARCNLYLTPELYHSLEPATFTLVDVPLESPAYVIYTSGSTGNPKGVLISHKAVMNTLHDINQRFGITDTDVVLGVSSFGFDLSVYDVFGTFLAGAKLVLAQNVNDMSNIEYLVKKHQVSIWNSVPQIMDIFMDSLTEQTAAESIKVVMLSGDWIPMYLPGKISEKCSRSQIYSLGGATEASIWSIYYPIPKESPLKNSIPYGMPLGNQEIYILSEERELMPIGMEGDIYIGGVGLADGYLNNPEKTGQAYVKDEKLGRIYKTGDRGILHREGFVEFRGRQDLQVKIRGFRVELGEIENKMREIEQIVNAIVVTKKDDFNQLHLCAYYIAEDEISEQDIRTRLELVLQNYMVPAYYVRMDAFPLTSNGKIERKNLPPVDFHAVEQEESKNPTTENEHLLVHLYKKVLHVDNIGINHNFFKFGGDSIKALQLIAAMRKYGKEIKMEDLFTCPTIKKLAKRVRITQSNAEQGRLSGEVDLAPIQKWMFERQFEASNYWTQIVTIDTRMYIDEALAKKAISQVMEHHDSLRFIMKMEQGEIRQCYQKPEELVASVVTFSNEYSKEDCMQSLSKTIDYKQGHLTALGILPKDDGTELIFVIHHLVVDTVSWMVILDDFLRICQGFSEGEENVILPAKTVSYQLWIEKLKSKEMYEKIAEDIPFWKETIARAKLSPVLENEHNNSLHNQDFKQFTIQLSEEETAQIQENVIRIGNYTMQDVLLLAIVKAFQTCCGVKEVLMQMEYHGRELTKQDVSRTVGWFTALYPIVFSQVPEAGLQEQLDNILKETGRIPNKGGSYGILKYCFKEEWDELLPAITFNYLGNIGLMNELVTSFDITQGQLFCDMAERISPIEINALMELNKLTVQMNIDISIMKTELAEELKKKVYENLYAMIQNVEKADDKKEFMKNLSDDVDIETISESFF